MSKISSKGQGLRFYQPNPLRSHSVWRFSLRNSSPPGKYRTFHCHADCIKTKSAVSPAFDKKVYSHPQTASIYIIHTLYNLPGHNAAHDDDPFSYGYKCRHVCACIPSNPMTMCTDTHILLIAENIEIDAAHHTYSFASTDHIYSGTYLCITYYVYTADMIPKEAMIPNSHCCCGGGYKYIYTSR